MCDRDDTGAAANHDYPKVRAAMTSQPWPAKLPVQNVRIARPTDQLDEVVRFYREGLGLPELDRFAGHAGYRGVLLELPGMQYTWSSPNMITAVRGWRRAATTCWCSIWSIGPKWSRLPPGWPRWAICRWWRRIPTGPRTARSPSRIRITGGSC